jgi:NTP pyrophosphatase (non-canonical NTP hydrolase)
MQKVLQKLLEFRTNRDWMKFHTAENIAKSIVLEAAEILQIFQWKTDKSLSDEEKKEIAEEMADVYNWLILLAHDLNIDLEQEALKKISKNAEKYPIEKSKGIATKYTKL